MRVTRTVKVRGIPIGGGAPVVVQSMTKTDTTDIEGTLRQIDSMVEAGCEIVRIAVPDDDAAAAMYAQGFAWSMQGIAPEVVAEVEKLLSENLLAKLPEARTAFEARSLEAWGETPATASTTSVPDGY